MSRDTYAPPGVLGVLDKHWEAYEVVADDRHRFLWMWHGFNIRVIAVPKNDPYSVGYDFAWCYPRNPRTVVGWLQAWNPATQDEPLGWHKRPTSFIRQAPERDSEPVYNRLRCVHGCYIDGGCRTIGCPGIK